MGAGVSRLGRWPNSVRPRQAAKAQVLSSEEGGRPSPPPSALRAGPPAPARVPAPARQERGSAVELDEDAFRGPIGSGP